MHFVVLIAIGLIVFIPGHSKKFKIKVVFCELADFINLRYFPSYRQVAEDALGRALPAYKEVGDVKK